jgi:hypothetical protein
MFNQQRRIRFPKAFFGKKFPDGGQNFGPDFETSQLVHPPDYIILSI